MRKKKESEKTLQQKAASWAFFWMKGECKCGTLAQHMTVHALVLGK